MPDADPIDLKAALAVAWPEAAGREAEIRIARAPGRVNLIGEHTDYNEGFVLPMAIDRDVRIAWLPASGSVELVRLDTGERGSFRLDEDRPPAGTWLDYPAGVARQLAAAGHEPRGLRGVVGSTLPVNAGLSSSAAFELASAWALLGAAAAGIDPLELARIAQRAENDYVGVQCGLMDQFASACGWADGALLLDCRSLEWQRIHMPSDLAIVVCHTGSSRRLGTSAYNARRRECEAAVRVLARDDPTITSLRDVDEATLEAAADRLDPTVLRRARHVVAENDRVGTVVAALEARDLSAIGRAFAASHASLRDLFEVSSPELDALVEIAGAVPGVVATRMTGAGFGGCTVSLVHPVAVEPLRARVEHAYPMRTGLQPDVIVVRAAAGAGLIPA